MKWKWTIHVSLATKTGFPGRKIKMEIEARTGVFALIKALAEIEVAPDELLHTIHVGPPYG